MSSPFPAAHCLRLCTSNVARAGLIPGQGDPRSDPSCCTAWSKEKKKKSSPLLRSGSYHVQSQDGAQACTAGTEGRENHWQHQFH